MYLANNFNYCHFLEVSVRLTHKDKRCLQIKKFEDKWRHEKVCIHVSSDIFVDQSIIIQEYYNCIAYIH